MKTQAKRAQTMWLKLGESRGGSIENQLTNSNSASNVNEKWSRSHYDLMRPDRVIAPQIPQNADIIIFMNFTLQECIGS